VAVARQRKLHTPIDELDEDEAIDEEKKVEEIPKQEKIAEPERKGLKKRLIMKQVKGHLEGQGLQGESHQLIKNLLKNAGSGKMDGAPKDVGKMETKVEGRGFMSQRNSSRNSGKASMHKKAISITKLQNGM